MPSKQRNKLPRIAAAEYEVHLTDSAAAAYERYFQRAKAAEERGEPNSSHCTTLRQIDECLETLIPHDPFNKRFALSGDLKSIFRIRKGRLRICWIGSSAGGRIDVIFISETPRKQGDANDPYAILSRRAAAGEFDHYRPLIGMKPRAKALTDKIQ